MAVTAPSNCKSSHLGFFLFFLVVTFAIVAVLTVKVEGSGCCIVTARDGGGAMFLWGKIRAQYVMSTAQGRSWTLP